MIIGIDIDDTITDSYEICFAYAQLFQIYDLKRDAKIDDKPTDHHLYVKYMHNWSDEETEMFWNKYYEEMISKIKPYTFAVETINKLKDEGNKIVLITARWPGREFNVKEATLNWLKENGIKFDDIIMDASDKAKIANEKKIDLFIDDSYRNCCAVSETGIKTFIMNTRTNKGLDKPGITRVYSWPDIYKKITDMKKGTN